MLFPIITFATAIAIAFIAAWFSIVGLMAIFAASAIPVALMAGSLEVGKLVAASWVYRNWKRAPFLLKFYLTIAVVVLMFITSMGIFGFLSKAHLEQAAQGTANVAKVERIDNDIIRFNALIERTEIKIAKLENETSDDSSDINAQIDAEQQRMDNAYARIQPAIDEQMEIIREEQKGSDEQVKSYTEQINRIDDQLQKLQTYADNIEDENNVKKIQAMIGTKVDGRYGYRTAGKVTDFIEKSNAEKQKLIAIVEDIRNSVNTDIIDQAREEIKRLRAMADREIQNAQDNINRLRNVLSQVGEIDNTDEIDTLVIKVSDTEQRIEVLLDEKFEIESEVRQLEAEVGPIKYIAELIYGETNPTIIDSAVRWLIIVFIFVFDPLAVILLVAANYSFANRNNHENRQQEMFDGLFHKNEEKTLDKTTSMSDNKDIDLDTEEETVEEIKDEIKDEKETENVEVVKSETKKPGGVYLDPAEIDLKNIDEKSLKEIKSKVEREINTKAEKRSGWLDDLNNGK